MELKLKIKNYKVFVIISVLLVSIFISSYFNDFPIQFNATSSMPIGFYRRVMTNPIKRGDVVSVCLLQYLAIVALQRGYLRTGRCPSKVLPLLKQVIALPGDTVLVTDKYLTVNGVRYTAPFMPFDHTKKPIQKFIRNGLYQSHGYWIYGANDAINSWDSRYYGAVDRNAILAVYKPLLIFSDKDVLKPSSWSARY